jgi:pectinesterase inhibitor-like protein
MSRASMGWMSVLLVVICFCRIALASKLDGWLTNVDLGVVLASNGSLIPLVCQATRYQELCSSSLSTDPRSSTAGNSTDLVKNAIDLGYVSQQESITIIQNFQNSSELDINSTSAALVCGETLEYGSARLAMSRDSLLVKPMQDIQAWLSAALQFQYDCFSAVSNVLDPPAMLSGVILPQINTTMQLISNALSMTDALAYYGSSPTEWLPPAESRPSNLSSVLLYISLDWAAQKDDLQQPLLGSALIPNVTVSQDGLSNYSTVQEAVDNAPSFSDERYVVYIKDGSYDGPIRVHWNKTCITFVGDGADKTVLTGNSNTSRPGMTTFQTASVGKTPNFKF